MILTITAAEIVTIVPVIVTMVLQSRKKEDY